MYPKIHPDPTPLGVGILSAINTDLSELFYRKYFTQENITIAAGSNELVRIDVSQNGYTPLCIFYIAGVSSNACIIEQGMSGSYAFVRFRNVTNASISGTANIGVLYSMNV